MGLTRIAIARPVFIFMLMIASVLLGLISIRSMRVEQNPDVAFGVITVSTVYPGAGPQEVAELVSRPLEEAVSGVNGLREVTSTSQEGISVVVVQLELGANVDVALNDVRARVDANVGRLPREVERPSINKLDSGSEPVLFLALSSDRMNSLQLRDLADNVLKDRFARIPGVGQVSVTGGDEREIQIQVNRDRLLAYGIGINDVFRSIQAATLNVPAGRVVTGDSEVSVRVPAEFRTVEEIQQMVLSVRDNAQQGSRPRIVKLSDIATVTDTSTERRSFSRLGGSDSIVIVLQKTKEGNAVEISKAAAGLIPQIEQEFGLKILKTQDQATIISESLFDLGFAIVFGIILVTATVYVFLHNFRGTLIVAIAIPLCIFVTFIVMRLIGFTINNLSMLALSLAVGVLIDDAIVVLENIYRHLKMGEDPREAAINGRSEIGLAAIAITLVDVVVFLPIGFMGGIIGQFFKPLALSFAACVLISLFVSFTVTPMLASRWYRRGEDVEHPQGWFANWFERGYGRVENGYRRLLEWALRHRWFVFLTGNIVLVGLFVAIAGSFAGKPEDALMMGVPLIQLCLAIGVMVLGVQVWTQRIGVRSFWRMVLVTSLVLTAVLSVFLWGRIGPGAPVAGFFGGLVGALLLFGVVGFFVNLLKPVARTRILLYSLLFGLTFPLAAYSGYAYVAYYKKEPAFKFAFFPPSDGGNVSIEIEMPAGSSLAATQRVVDRIERVAMAHPDAKYVLTNVGFLGAAGFGGSGSVGSQYARVSVSLNSKRAILDSFGIGSKPGEKLRTKADTTVAADLLEQIGRVPGARIKVAATNAQGFGAPIQMSFSSTDREKMVETAVRVRQRLEDGAVRGVINPDLSSKPGKPELQLVPDRERLADVGLTPADVASAMRVMYEGNDDTKFRVLGREYPIRVMLDLDSRNDPKTLEQLPISFSEGRPVFLNTVMRTERGTSTDKVERRNRQEEITLTADLLPGFAAGSVQREIDALVASEKLLGEGVTARPLGQADFQARESGFLFGALALGIVLVYMLLASLYDNLLYPFIIQLSQPQAMVGALVALILTDKTLNIVGFIGIIALVGLVGKNAILLVDYANTLRSRGRDRHDALVEAGPVRLRPILMTTIALVLGTLPVALAIGRGSEFRETIGITIIGGMIVSTVLTLVVIPCSYTIFDDLSEMIARMSGRRPADSGTPAEAETPSATPA